MQSKKLRSNSDTRLRGLTAKRKGSRRQRGREGEGRNSFERGRMKMQRGSFCERLRWGTYPSTSRRSLGVYERLSRSQAPDEHEADIKVA